MKTVSSAAVLVCILLLSGADSRMLTNRLFPDGPGNWFSSSNLTRLKRTLLAEHSTDTEEEGEISCDQMYGFLPCSKNIAGHLFLIVVYEYLLFQAESYIASGSERIFKMLGPGVFGASVFQILRSLPESFILLASGLASSHETAHEYLLTGVGLLTGSSILLLTLLWGTCVMLSSRRFSSDHHLDPNLFENKKYNRLGRFLFSLWPGYGALTNLSTSYTSRIMLLSVVPLIMIQVTAIFRLSHSGENICLLVTLAVSIMFLIAYFLYELLEPSIQKMRLLYIKNAHLAEDILKYMQHQTSRKLLTADGSPNVQVLKRLFRRMDRNRDEPICINNEFNDFVEEIKSRKVPSEMENAAADEIMKKLDTDKNGKVTKDEFVGIMTKLLDGKKDEMSGKNDSVNYLQQILQSWVQKKMEERETMSRLIPEILKHLQNSAYGSLLSEDGTPDIPAIKRLFKRVDLDKDEHISTSELKELLTNIDFGIIPSGVAAAELMKQLDISGDGFLNEEEFVTGLSTWLNRTYHHKTPDNYDNYQKAWEMTDKLLPDKRSLISWIKAIAFIVLGIVILGLLAEPLIHSVRHFSSAAKVQSFYVAFVFVPLAINARIAASAVAEARHKELHTTSLTLCEIYNTVFMNNILGMIVLLSLLYFRSLAWDFSAEVLMVLIVTGIIGGFASLSIVYPVWTSILAYLLYPMSLTLLAYLPGPARPVS